MARNAFEEAAWEATCWLTKKYYRFNQGELVDPGNTEDRVFSGEPITKPVSQENCLDLV